MKRSPSSTNKTARRSSSPGNGNHDSNGQTIEQITRNGNGLATDHNLDFAERLGASATLASEVPRLRPTESGPIPPWVNPTQLERPAFLLNFPFSYATGAANNPWMTDLPVD